MKLSRSLAFALIALPLSTASLAQPVVEAWSKHDFSAVSAQVSVDVTSDSAGNCFVSGSEATGTGTILRVRKYDLAGNPVYNTPIGVAGEVYEAGDVVIDGAGNAIVVSTRTAPGAKQIVVHKISPAGVKTWSKDFGGAGDESANRIVMAENSGFALAGYSQTGAGNADFLLIKADSSGNQIWSRIYSGGTANDYVLGLSRDTAGNMYAGGSSQGAGTGLDILAVKYDKDGVLKFFKRHNGSFNIDDLYGGSAVDSGGNFFLAGTQVLGVTGADVLLTKYSPTGTVVWQRIYNSSDNKLDGSIDVFVDGSGNCYVGGVSLNSSDLPMFLALKYNSAGTPIFATRHGPLVPGSFMPIPGARFVSADRWGFTYLCGAAILPGSSKSDIVTLKLSQTTGSMVWMHNYPLANQPTTEFNPTGLNVHFSGDLYVTGVGKDPSPNTAIDSFRLRQAAIANVDTHHMLRDTIITKGATDGVKGNDYYGTRSNVVQVTGVTHGALSLNATGAFTYDPDPGFSGDDSFTYKLVEGPFQSNTTTVAFRVHPAVNLLQISPNSVGGGTPTTGTLTMGGVAPASGTSVALSSNSAAATVPASVLVQPGLKKATFTINTTVVGADTATTITASRDGLSVSAGLLVKKTALALITVTPASVVGGNSTTGKAELNGLAPAGGKVVTLSDNTSAITVPANVTIAAGAKSANFNVSTSPVSAAVTRQVSGSLEGVTKTANLTLNPPSLLSLAVNPASVKGGSPSTGTVTLTGPAFAGGIAVTLTSGSVLITVPASVSVPFNQKTASFQAATKPVTTTTTRSITASYNGVSRVVNLTLMP